MVATNPVFTMTATHFEIRATGLPIGFCLTKMVCFWGFEFAQIDIPHGSNHNRGTKSSELHSVETLRGVAQAISASIAIGFLIHDVNRTVPL
jgi:hypothetical protein